MGRKKKEENYNVTLRTRLWRDNRISTRKSIFRMWKRYVCLVHEATSRIVDSLITRSSKRLMHVWK